MTAEMLPFDITYEEFFVAPAFALASPSVGNVGVLKALYDSLHSRYAILSKDMRVAGGNSLSEVLVTIQLFNGNGLIEVSVDKVRIVFRGISNQADREVAKDCVELVQKSLVEVLNVEFGWASFNINSRYRLVEPTPTVSEHLRELFGSRLSELGKTNDGKIAERVGLIYENDCTEEGWDLVFHASRSQDNERELSVFAIGKFSNSKVAPTIADKVLRIDQAFDAFFERANIEFPKAKET